MHKQCSSERQGFSTEYLAYNAQILPLNFLSSPTLSAVQAFAMGAGHHMHERLGNHGPNGALRFIRDESADDKVDDFLTHLEC